MTDDQDDVRLVVTLNLRRWGYPCDEASSAEEAIACCRADPPDVLLLDVSMPGTDGVALLGILREQGIAPPRVILLSAMERDRLAATARALDVDHLSKPFGLSELRAVCARAAGEAPP